MQLNPDCIRDILLAVEEQITSINSIIIYQEPTNLNLSNYSNDVILYHINQCDMANLLIIGSWYNSGCSIRDLTPAGHEFLANIREDNNWNKTKSIAKEVGSQSLKVLTTVASNVIASTLKSYLQI